MPFEGPRARAARHAREGKAAKRKQIAAAAMEQSGSDSDDSVAHEPPSKSTRGATGAVTDSLQLMTLLYGN